MFSHVLMYLKPFVISNTARNQFYLVAVISHSLHKTTKKLHIKVELSKCNYSILIFTLHVPQRVLMYNILYKCKGFEGFNAVVVN